MFSLSNLEPEQIESIRALEAGTGKTLLAFSKVRVRTDELDDDHLDALRRLEADLGVILVAVKPDEPRASRRRGANPG